MKNIKIVCDFREDFNNFSDSNIVFNDHPTRKSVEEICRILNACGYNSEIFGGVNRKRTISSTLTNICRSHG